MATNLSGLLELAIKNIQNGSWEGRALGLAQVEQAKKLFDKGYKSTDWLDELLEKSENEDCQLDFTKYYK